MTSLACFLYISDGINHIYLWLQIFMNSSVSNEWQWNIFQIRPMFNSLQYKCLLYVRCSVNTLQQIRKKGKFKNWTNSISFSLGQLCFKISSTFFFLPLISMIFFYFLLFMFHNTELPHHPKKKTTEWSLFNFIYSQHFHNLQ